jgi:hypothetical protein
MEIAIGGVGDAFGIESRGRIVVPKSLRQRLGSEPDMSSGTLQ